MRATIHQGRPEGSRFTDMSEKERSQITDEIREMRRSYGEIGLTEAIAGDNPTSLFTDWLAQAAANP